MAIDSGLEDLKRQHPEWEPWLAVVQVILNEIGDPKWDAAVPVEVGHQQGKVPLLAGLPKRHRKNGDLTGDRLRKIKCACYIPSFT